MQLIVLISVLSVTTAIRVPVVWPTNPQKNQNLGLTKQHYATDDGNKPTLNYVDGNTRNNKISNTNRDLGRYKQTRHHNPKTVSFSKPIYYNKNKYNYPVSANGWIPSFGGFIPNYYKIGSTKKYVTKPSNNYESKHNRFSNKHRDDKRKLQRPPIPLQNKFNPREIFIGVSHHPLFDDNYEKIKGYKDIEYNTPKPHYVPKFYVKDYTFLTDSNVKRAAEQHIPKEEEDAEEIPPEEPSNIEKTPISDHEIPKDIPTRPIYPGEGKWATRGLKHRPYVSNQKYTKLEEDEERPEGYDIFQDGEKVFAKQQNAFRENFDIFPEQHKLGKFRKEEENEGDSEDIEQPENIFVPTKLYAQVRRSEDVEHLPRDPNEDRLREIIKDSKIHTVYTEEGYEDLAYDHAGHEKNAENHEDHSDSNKGEKKSGYKNRPSRGSGAKPGDNLAEGTDYESAKPPKKNKKVNKMNFQKTKETKRMALKDMVNGDTELEISSEIKIMTNPHNVTKAHKYIKIIPSKKNDTNDKVNITDNPEKITNPSSQNNETNTGNIFPHESIPQYGTKLSKSHVVKRQKRFTNDFPKIEVDTSFIDKFKDIPIPKKEPIEKKYPYYNIRNTEILHKNSPLRYAEDMKNIPDKRFNNLAFYDQARTKMACAEVETTVEPIPERISKLNSDQNDEDVNEKTKDLPETPQLPRLKGLGDKIDCFKVRYFGENPLDSPIFTEENVEAPEPIFKEFRKFNVINDNYNEVASASELKNTTYKPNANNNTATEINDDKSSVTNKVLPEETTVISSTTDTINKSESFTNEKPLIALAIINIEHSTQPNHIYDKIDSAQSISALENDNDSLQSNITNNTDADLDTYTMEESNRSSKQLKLFNVNASSNTTAEGQLEDVEFDDTDLDSNSTTHESLPEAQELRRRRRRRRRKPGKHFPNKPYPAVRPHFKPFYFTTVKPQYLSEVHYKDEIQPDEQLNVFSDIINNIKNSTYDPYDVDASETVELTTIRIQSHIDRIPTKNIKIPKQKLRIKPSKYNTKYQTDDDQPTSFYHVVHSQKLYPENNEADPDNYYDDYSTSKPKPSKTRSNLKPNKQTIVEWYEHAEESDPVIQIATTQKSSRKRVRRPSSQLTPEIAEEIIKNTEITENNDSPTTKVLGLVPPPQRKYQTIYDVEVDESNPVYFSEKSQNVNNFFVQGMKPPPKQITMNYADYSKMLSTNRIRRRNFVPPRHSRFKRSAQRPAYSEIRRGNSRQQEEVVVEEEEDDYVPQRNRNFHYDVETGRVVYDKKAENERTRAPILEEEVEEEVTPASKPQNIRDIIERTTRDPNEPTYLDFISKLKSSQNYQYIPEPKKKEEEKEEAKNAETTTTEGKPGIIPAFLSIVSQLKSDNEYKYIEEPKDKKSKKTTTAAPVEYEEIEEENPKDIKNSPGAVISESASSQEESDSSDAPSKPKNYNPRTSIDYSKYKTIERAPVQSTPSSEDEESIVPPVINRRMEEQLPTHQREYVADQEMHAQETRDMAADATLTTTEKLESTPSQRRRFRNRKRPTTTTTEPPQEQEATTTKKIIRRQRIRTSVRTRSESTINEEGPTSVKPRSYRGRSDSSENRDAESSRPKSVRRRSQSERAPENQEIPSNHKAFYSPVVEPEASLRRQLPKSSVAPKDLEVNGGEDENIKNVEVFKKYNKDEKHGGNYRKETEDDTESAVEAVVQEEKNLENTDDLLIPSDSESVLKSSNNNSNSKGEEEHKRFSDVVPKPFSFYSDPKLPSRVNRLKETQTDKTNDKTGGDYFDEEVPAEVVESSATTKKPLFIKDPSQRLYYYAPLR